MSPSINPSERKKLIPYLLQYKKSAFSFARFILDCILLSIAFGLLAFIIVAFMAMTRISLPSFLGIMYVLLYVGTLIFALVYQAKDGFKSNNLISAEAEAIFDKVKKHDLEKVVSFVNDTITLPAEEIVNEFTLCAYHPFLLVKSSYNKTLNSNEVLVPSGYIQNQQQASRYSPIEYTKVFCTVDKLVIFQTHLNLLTGHLLNTTIQHLYFHEISFYGIASDSFGRYDLKQKGKPWRMLTGDLLGIKYKIDPSAKEEIYTESFVIETRGGSRVAITLPSNKYYHVDQEIQGFLKARDKVAAIQKVLDDKKRGLQLTQEFTRQQNNQEEII